MHLIGICVPMLRLIACYAIFVININLFAKALTSIAVNKILSIMIYEANYEKDHLMSHSQWLLVFLGCCMKDIPLMRTVSCRVPVRKGDEDVG